MNQNDPAPAEHSDVPAESPALSGDSAIYWLGIAKAVWRARKGIVYFTVAVSVLTALYSLIAKPSFESTTTLMEASDTGNVANIPGLSEVAPLARLAGGGGSIVDLYPTLILSEAVLSKVIYTEYETEQYSESVNLVRIWKIEDNTPGLSHEKALRRMRAALTVEPDRRSEVIYITISTGEAQLSADILNNLTASLDEFMRVKRTSNATERREWIEARLAEVETDLRRTENNLKEFREKNREIVDSPQLMMEEGRLVNAVGVNNAVYTELRVQHELVRIEEIKNTSIINVLDPARPAARRSKPKRKQMLVIAFFLSGFMALAAVAVWYQYGNEFLAILHEFRNPGERR